LSLFDKVIIVDWSGGNDRGASPKKDAIWACVAGEIPVYLRNRALAEDWIGTQIAACQGRVLIGFDFPFGYPEGFAEVVTGQADALALWTWFEARVEDSPKANNRFDLAGELNRHFAGVGPFWGNALAREIVDLPRKGRSRYGHGMREKRAAEAQAKGAFACWQMSGAGSVGGQTMMGLPVLARLRARFESAAWPFEPWREARVVLAEVWPSLIAQSVVRQQVEGEIKDAAQVRVLAGKIAGLSDTVLAAMLDVTEPRALTEGWILGLGREADLDCRE
jgi:molybdopterin molybdotransferase